MKLDLDQDECWVILEYVRRTRGAPEYGTEWDLDFILKVAACILEPAGAVDVTTGELLQMSRQISADLMYGPRFIGRDILRKVYGALLAKDTDDEHEPIPAVWSRADYADEDDAPADAGAYTKAEPESRLPGSGPTDS